MERLFVYGTLAPGRENHNVFEGVPGSWETASLKGELLDEGWGAELGCPGIVPSEEGEEVEGYIFSSGYLSEYWAMLDELESNGYRRAPVLVKIESGEEKRSRPTFMHSIMPLNKRISGKLQVKAT